ncbi:tyrosine-protein kinase receptor torso isoform X1 [Drosophila montana]|uniref:tyrosine-protein kinase receptor torso isoform X1 n=1 Tax=Drosophila montana TaxID=40370 RepID=UPI00313F08EA
MLLLYAKYVFIFWALFESYRGQVMLMRQLSEDEALLNLTACSKNCLIKMPQKNFTGCYEYCKNDNSSGLMPTKVRKIQENFLLKLVCRTEYNLTFRINWVQHARHDSIQSAPDAMFIIRTDAKLIDLESFLYLSDDSFFTIPELESNTTYNVTALAVHADGAYSFIAIEEGFQTLRRGYQPSKMGEVRLKQFQEQPDNLHRIAAVVEWQPSAERNCYFDMIYYSTDSQSMEAPTPVHFRDPRQLYSYTIPNMEFGEQFRIGVRTVNDKNSLESPVQWLILQAPSCLDWFDYNYTLCAPLKPSNVSVQQQHFDQDVLALNVSWSLPRYLPDYYTLYILDLHTDSEQAKYTVAGNASHFYISNITVLGTNFEVHLVAHTEGGQNASMQFLSKAPLEVWMKESSVIKLILFLVVPVCCILALCSMTLRKHRRQECKKLETKELKSAPNQATDFHLSLINNSSLLATLATEDNFELDDELEVEPHAVLLQDVLGEGAFGLVRRGVYKQRQVAVKLLKDQPNEEDVQAFKCEIQMLRAVGRHPNIVGIVGYSTRFSNRMMLLTEYCGLGSLQSFLRDEWKFQQERSAQNMRLKLNAAKQPKAQNTTHQQRSRHLLYNDTRIEDINGSMLSTLEEESETDLSRNSSCLDSYNSTKATLAADNKSYGLHEIENIDANAAAVCLKTILKRNQKEQPPGRSCTVSFENKEYFEPPAANEQMERQPLKYADLLDIAHQVAVGMDFLAQNKIVHRDLAARNVLISLDRTIKIADFGLSRDVYHENVYRKSGGSGKLPIKWLALESLTHQVYTSQSDVWSFGVLLYEITTLGGMPYPSISPRDLLHLLRQGLRMRRPDGCTDEMFALMESCWCSVPGNRPTFAELKQRLDKMIVATKEVPLRLLQQSRQQNLQTNEQTDNPHSKVEQLPPDDGTYLQPLH